MLFKNELDTLLEYMETEARSLGIPNEEVKNIEVQTAANMRFTFPCHTNQLELIRRVTRQVASSLPFPEEALDDIGLAIDEACSNVINHSYPEETKGAITVDFELDQSKLVIFLIDTGVKGQSFNPDLLSMVDKEEYLQALQKGGLGVYLIKKIMDEVEYTVSPGIKNCLKMVKYIQVEK